MSFFPDYFTVIRGAPWGSQAFHPCSQTCHWHSQACHRCSQDCRQCSHMLLGARKVLSGTPRCSQTYHNHSHGTPVPVIRDPSYSERRPECPPKVWYSPEIDASKFTLHILSDTPGGFQRLKYILLMSHILNAGHVGDAVAVAVAVAAGDRLAAACDGRPTHRQNSWESHTSFSSSNKADETIKRIVGLLYQLFWDVIKEVLITAALIVVRLCHRSVHTSWVDPSADHAADTVYLFGWNLWRGRTTIRVKTMHYICACIINCENNVACIAHMLCFTSWTKLWQDCTLACFPGRQAIVDGRHGEANECQVDFINQWSIFHSHLSDAIEICPVNKMHNFSHCKLKLALLNWLSSQQSENKGTLNLPHKCLWGM